MALGGLNAAFDGLNAAFRHVGYASDIADVYGEWA